MEDYSVKEDELDFGEVLYEKSNAKSIYDAPTGKVGAKGWAQRIYMLLLGAGLLGWFAYSLVSEIFQDGLLIAIVNHFAALFVLLVAELILMLSAFGGWGKFARFAIKHNLTRKRGIEGVQTRKLDAELKAADANKGREDAIRIYREQVVVVNKGETVTINQSELQNVRCEPNPRGYQLTFVLYDGREIVADMLLPISDLPVVKKHFDRFDYTPAERGKGYLRKKFPLLAFMFIPLLIGIALTVIHFLVLPEMPLLFGLIFTFIGLMVIIAQFSDVAIIKHGVMPIGFGLILTSLPLGVMFTIAQLTATTEEPLTIAAMLSTFTPIHAGLGLFLGLGPMLIIVGIAGIVDCVRM